MAVVILPPPVVVADGLGPHAGGIVGKGNGFGGGIPGDRLGRGRVVAGIVRRSDCLGGPHGIGGRGRAQAGSVGGAVDDAVGGVVGGPVAIEGQAVLRQGHGIQLRDDGGVVVRGDPGSAGGGGEPAVEGVIAPGGLGQSVGRGADGHDQGVCPAAASIGVEGQGIGGLAVQAGLPAALGEADKLLPCDRSVDQEVAGNGHRAAGAARAAGGELFDAHIVGLDRVAAAAADLYVAVEGQGGSVRLQLQGQAGRLHRHLIESDCGGGQNQRGLAAAAECRAGQDGLCGLGLDHQLVKLLAAAQEGEIVRVASDAVGSAGGQVSGSGEVHRDPLGAGGDPLLGNGGAARVDGDLRHSGKGALAQGGHRLGHGEVCQRRAPGECAAADGGQVLPVYMPEAGAARKGVVRDRGDAVGQDHIHHGGVPIEGVGGNAGDLHRGAGAVQVVDGHVFGDEHRRVLAGIAGDDPGVRVDLQTFGVQEKGVDIVLYENRDLEGQHAVFIVVELGGLGVVDVGVGLIVHHVVGVDEVFTVRDVIAHHGEHVDRAGADQPEIALQRAVQRHFGGGGFGLRGVVRHGTGVLPRLCFGTALLLRRAAASALGEGFSVVVAVGDLFGELHGDGIVVADGGAVLISGIEVPGLLVALGLLMLAADLAAVLVFALKLDQVSQPLQGEGAGGADLNVAVDLSGNAVLRGRRFGAAQASADVPGPGAAPSGGMGEIDGAAHLAHMVVAEVVALVPLLGEGPGGGAGRGIGDRLRNGLSLRGADGAGIGLSVFHGHAGAGVVEVFDLEERHVFDDAQLIGKGDHALVVVSDNQRILNGFDRFGLVALAGPVGGEDQVARGALFDTGDQLAFVVGPAHEGIAVQLQVGQRQARVHGIGLVRDHLEHRGARRGLELDDIGDLFPVGVKLHVLRGALGDGLDGGGVAAGGEVVPAQEAIARHGQVLQGQAGLLGEAAGVAVFDPALGLQPHQIGVAVGDVIGHGVVVAGEHGRLLLGNQHGAADGTMGALRQTGGGGGGGYGLVDDHCVSGRGDHGVLPADLCGSLRVAEELTAFGAGPESDVAVLGAGGVPEGGGGQDVGAVPMGGLQLQGIPVLIQIASGQEASDEDDVGGVDGAVVVDVSRRLLNGDAVASRQIPPQEDDVPGGYAAVAVHVAGHIVQDGDGAVGNGQGDRFGVGVHHIAGHIGEPDPQDVSGFGVGRHLEGQGQDHAVLDVGRGEILAVPHKVAGGDQLAGLGHGQDVPGRAVGRSGQGQPAVIFQGEGGAQDAGVVFDGHVYLDGIAGQGVDAACSQGRSGCRVCGDCPEEGQQQNQSHSHGEDSFTHIAHSFPGIAFLRGGRGEQDRRAQRSPCPVQQEGSAHLARPGGRQVLHRRLAL